MPIYEYKCGCGREKDVILPFAERGNIQTCECGDIMLRKVSIVNFYIKPTGRQMALDTLNSNTIPRKRRKYVEKLAAQGL